MKEAFKETMKRIGFECYPEQEEFYNRIQSFMESDKKVLINQGGMGLGKTISTAKIIQENIDKYKLIFVATPTSPLKYSWCGELIQIGLRNKFSVWPSKDSVCVFKKVFNIKNFNTNLCNDDCIFRKSCEASEEYKTRCKLLAQEYCDLLPKANPKTYYETILEKNNYDKNQILKLSQDISSRGRTKNNDFKEICNIDCLYSPSRMCLRNELNYEQNIIVGDYFGFFSPSMFENVTKRNPSQTKSLLIIDEGHLLPGRAKDYNSNQIHLSKDIDGLINELKYYHRRIKGNQNRALQQFVGIMKKYYEVKTKTQLLNSKFSKLNYNNFLYDIQQIMTLFDISEDVEDFIIRIRLSLKSLDENISAGETLETKKTYSLKIKQYLESLSENSTKKEYYSTMKKEYYYGESDILLSVRCINPSERIQTLLSYWDKVIIITGTIREKEKFLSDIGLTQMKSEYEYHELIQRFNVKKNTFLLSEDNFNSTNRKNTYAKNRDRMNSVLDKMSGKTIIFVQSKKDSINVKESIDKNKYNIIDFCTKENNDEINPDEFEELKDMFSKEDNKKTIGIINIRGRVEGHNFVDEAGDFSLSNIIIYGFPLGRSDDFTEAQYKYNLETFDSYQKAKRYTALDEPINKIHQAVYRAKRTLESNPIIILWDERFGSNKENICLFKDSVTGDMIKLEKDNNIFNNLPTELSENEGTFERLMKFIKEVENERNSKK